LCLACTASASSVAMATCSRNTSAIVARSRGRSRPPTARAVVEQRVESCPTLVSGRALAHFLALSVSRRRAPAAGCRTARAAPPAPRRRPERECSNRSSAVQSGGDSGEGPRDRAGFVHPLIAQPPRSEPAVRRPASLTRRTGVNIRQPAA
jgi:hypothetical protein